MTHATARNSRQPGIGGESQATGVCRQFRIPSLNPGIGTARADMAVRSYRIRSPAIARESMTLVEAAGLAGPPIENAPTDGRRLQAVELLWEALAPLKLAWFLNEFIDDARILTIIQIFKTFPKKFESDNQVETWLLRTLRGRALDLKWPRQGRPVASIDEETVTLFPGGEPEDPTGFDPELPELRLAAAACLRERHRQHPIVRGFELDRLLLWVDAASGDDLRQFLHRQDARAALRTLLAADRRKDFDDLCDCVDGLVNITDLARAADQKAPAIRTRQKRIRRDLLELVRRVEDGDERARLQGEVERLMQRWRRGRLRSPRGARRRKKGGK
jgi:hypothetical protein